MKNLLILVCLLVSIDAGAQSWMLLKPENRLYKTTPGMTTDLHNKYVPVNPPDAVVKKIYIKGKTITKIDTVVVWKVPVNNTYNYNYTYPQVTLMQPVETAIPKLIPKAPEIDPMLLKQQRNNGYTRIFGGFLTQLAGVGIIVTQWQPAEMRTTMKITPNRVQIHSELDNHADNNTVVGIWGGIFIAGGTWLEIQGFKRVHAANNGILIDF